MTLNEELKKLLETAPISSADRDFFLSQISEMSDFDKKELIIRLKNIIYLEEQKQKALSRLISES
jgi:hypothetical protein